MLLKNKKINRLMFFDCKCKECRATRKMYKKIEKSRERAKIKKYIKDNMD